MTRIKRISTLLLIAGAAAGLSGAQDVRSIDMRLSSLEQRFYSLESRLNSVEQMARSASRPAPSTSGQNLEIERLRNEVESIKRRMREIECGVIRLDERTLPAAAKQERGAAKDPCRADAQSPVRISGRP